MKEKLKKMNINLSNEFCNINGYEIKKIKIAIKKVKKALFFN